MGYSSKQAYLTEMIQEFQRNGITSIFVDPRLDMIEGAKKTGTDRIELYTEAFAHQYGLGNQNAIEPYIAAAVLANDLGLGINAGHDLSLDNIQFLNKIFQVYWRFLSDTLSLQSRCI
jgi:pyridoxine 5-phosphate synthase